MKIINVKDLMNTPQAFSVRRVFVDNQIWYEFDVHGKDNFFPNCTYDISLERIESLDDLLKWVYHLTEKRWISSRTLRDFMTLVSHDLNKKLFLKR